MVRTREGAGVPGGSGRGCTVTRNGRAPASEVTTTFCPPRTGVPLRGLQFAEGRGIPSQGCSHGSSRGSADTVAEATARLPVRLPSYRPTVLPSFATPAAGPAGTLLNGPAHLCLIS
jgi:hypothetical protein